MFPVVDVPPPMPTVAELHRGFETAKAKTRRVGSIFVAEPLPFVITEVVTRPADQTLSLTFAHAPSRAVDFGVLVITPESSESAAEMLYAVKKATGWSWDRLAAALRVTRQAVHGWTLGKEITPSNHERLARLRSAVAYVNRGSPDANRIAFNTSDGNGGIVASLLDAGRFDEFRNVLGKGVGKADATEKPRLSNFRRGRDAWIDELAATPDAEPDIRIIERAPPRKLVLRRGA